MFYFIFLFSELLDPKLGDLKASLQINFMVELGWLLAQYHIMGHRLDSYYVGLFNSDD